MISVKQKLDSIELLIADLQVNYSQAQRIAVIESLHLQLSDLELYHHFGTSSYGRNLVFSCDEFEIILMCWQPGQYSVAHDHNGSLCVMKCLVGELGEQRFQKHDQSIYPIGEYTLAQGSTAFITDEQGLHSIGNYSAQDACSLHCYFPPIHNTNIYALENGTTKKVSSSFTSEYGVKK